MRIDQTNRPWRLRRFAQARLLALLAAWPLSTLAVGLAEPVVKSHLGARLQVQIPLILDQGERADEIKVRFVSAADRALLGSSPQDSAVQMRLAVVMSGRSGPSISVTSAGSVREPVLTFVIEVKTNSTRFMREYTVLLDPANYRGAHKIASVRSPQTEPAPIAAAVPQRSAALSPSIDGDLYGPVALGDTLSELGAKLRADSSVSVSQMSIALFRANPQAFIGNDVNRLVAGAYLRVPNNDESTAMSSRTARERLYGPALPSAKPSVTANGKATADVSATLQRNADKLSDQVPLEPEYRLSVLAADPASYSKVKSVISRLSGNEDIAVRDLVARMKNARQAGEELSRESLDLRGRIAAADTRISKLASELREGNERIAAVQVAIESKRSPPLHSIATVPSNVDMPVYEEQLDSRSSTAWQRLAQFTSQASQQIWLGTLAALFGVWLLVRRSQR